MSNLQRSSRSRSRSPVDQRRNRSSRDQSPNRNSSGSGKNNGKQNSEHSPRDSLSSPSSKRRRMDDEEDEDDDGSEADVFDMLGNNYGNTEDDDDLINAMEAKLRDRADFIDRYMLSLKHHPRY